MSGIRRHPIRFLLGLIGFFLFLLGAALDFIFVFALTGRARTRRGRAVWQQRWAGIGLRVLRGRAEIRGPLPAGGILASNHLSYVDILVLGSLQPVVFVAKADVERWPVLGWLAKCAGTLFIRREQRSHVADVARQIAPVIEEGLPLLMFLEGTSTGGTHILPFRPSLLEPVVANHWPATPVWIGYSLADGSVEDEIAYWRDMTLFPHLLNLLTKKSFTAHVAFGEPVRAPGDDRKELARRLQRQVCALAGEFGRNITVGSHWHALPEGPKERSGVAE